MTSTVTFHVGDVFDVMRTMPDQSADCLITSPPFLALRSYLPSDHPLKSKEIGSEPTPAHYLQTLLELTAEWRRLLTPTGSLCVELGDTYSGSGGAGGDYNEDGLREGQEKFRQRRSPPLGDGDAGPRFTVDGKGGPGWPLAKSLCGIPALYEIALEYGIHPLTGQPSPAGQWRVRNRMPWTRPNPPVGALGDKFRPATSYVTVACTSANRWFDLDAVRQPGNSFDRPEGGPNGSKKRGPDITTDTRGLGDNERILKHDPAGAPPLDWHHDDETQDWQPLHRLPTAPYPGAHYATYPLALPLKLIKAMCPLEVCRECGEPRRRITETERVPKRPEGARFLTEQLDEARASRGMNGDRLHAPNLLAANTTLGWTDCGHQQYRPGHVLDPFAGSGTTLQAAALSGRDATGIDLDERNKDLTLERLRADCHVTIQYDTDQSRSVWSVNPELPGIKHQHPDQQSLFG